MRYLRSRSDAESISTTTSQESRGSNKENNRPDDDTIITRKKNDYARVTIFLSSLYPFCT